MKKTISLLLTAAVLTTTATLNAADKAPNTLSTAEKAAGWKSLFDGKSTSEFRNYKKDAVSDGWKVVDGAIVWTKKGAGDLITKKNVMVLLTQNLQVLAEDRIATLLAVNVVSAHASMAMRAIVPLFVIASEDGTSAKPSAGALACASSRIDWG